MSENDAILKVNGLKTYFYQASGVSKAVDGVSFTLKEGTTMGIVGESGSGKSVTSASVMRLMPAKTGKIVNIKKGQFLAPHDMVHVVKKAREAALEAGLDPDSFTVCERGATFGYGNLVSDMRSLAIMRETGAPVVFDATHSVQLPGGNGTSSGGDRRFVPVLARAATAVGVAGLFMETHPTPEKALSDGPNSVPLDRMEELLTQLKAIDSLVKSTPYLENDFS